MRVLSRGMLVLLFLWAAGTAFAEGPPAAPPAKVTTTKVVERDTSQKKGMIGVLYFDRFGDISTEVGGLVKKIYFREGDRVKRGDRLVALNTDFLDREIAREKARIERVSLRIEQTKRNLERFEALFKEEAASETDFEDLSFSHRELIKERETLSIGLEIIRLRKKKSVIRAPFDGMILSKGVDLGGWIDKGSTICRIGAFDSLYVQLPVAETIMKLLKKGDKVDAVINAYDKKVVGEIVGVRPRADEKTKNVYLKVRIPLTVDLVENMSVTVQVPTRKGEVLKMVPRDAVVKFKGKDFIYSVKEGKAMIIPLQVVSFMGNEVALANTNLVSGMAVVVDGNERLKPGQAVVVTGEK